MTIKHRCYFFLHFITFRQRHMPLLKVRDKFYCFSCSVCATELFPITDSFSARLKRMSLLPSWWVSRARMLLPSITSKTKKNRWGSPGLFSFSHGQRKNFRELYNTAKGSHNSFRELRVLLIRYTTVPLTNAVAGTKLIWKFGIMCKPLFESGDCPSMYTFSRTFYYLCHKGLVSDLTLVRRLQNFASWADFIVRVLQQKYKTRL